MTVVNVYPIIESEEEIGWVPPAGCALPRFHTESGVLLEERLRSFKVDGDDILSEHDGKRNLAIAWLVAHVSDQYIGEQAREWLGDEEWIYCVAEKSRNETIHTVPAPGRHHHVYRYLSRFDARENSIDMTHGFMVYKAGASRFVGRKEGMQIASKNGQLWRVNKKGSYDGLDLFSEDLW